MEEEKITGTIPEEIKEPEPEAQTETPQETEEKTPRSRGRKKAEKSPVDDEEAQGLTFIPPTTTEAAQAPKNGLKTEIPNEGIKLFRLKPSLRHGFQLKGRYYSRGELGRKSVLEKLYKQYPGLFENKT